MLGTPSDNVLRHRLTQATSDPLTYGEVGATLGPELPRRYTHTRRSVSLGGEPSVFHRASGALRRWEMHLDAGFRVVTDGRPLAPETTVIVAKGLGLITAMAPCRVVYVIDESDRFGFGYGTLPGHPEAGEEAFIVNRAQDGDVSFIVVAFSRPQELLVRLGGPISRLAQRRATAAYLRAMRDIALRVESSFGRRARHDERP